MGAIKGIGGLALGVAVFVGIIFIGYFLITGTAVVAAWAIPFLSAAMGYAFIACVLVLLPMAVFQRTRAWSGIGLFIASYVFGLSMWMYGFIYTYLLWGVLGIVIGLGMFGLGVVPIGMLALAFHSEWGLAGQLLVGVILTFGCRALSIYLTDKASRVAAERAAKIITVEPTATGG